jgi:hypothetical protein
MIFTRSDRTGRHRACSAKVGSLRSDRGEIDRDGEGGDVGDLAELALLVVSQVGDTTPRGQSEKRDREGCAP